MLALTAGSYASITAALVTLVGASGCGNIANEVASQKIGQAYRVATGQPSLDPNEPDAIDYIESPYSKRSYIDYRDNIYSIKNSLYGNIDQSAPAAKSVMTFLKDNGYSGVNDLQSALDNAIAKPYHMRQQRRCLRRQSGRAAGRRRDGKLSMRSTDNLRLRRSG